MSIIGKISKWIGSIFGSSSSSSTTSTTYVYEPDKVKAAEIERDRQLQLANKEIERLELERDTQLRLADKEAERLELERDTQLRLADKEAERIELMREAQIELVKAQTMSQMMIDKARVDGMSKMVEQFVKLQEQMSEVAQKRIEIIESGSMSIVREIEGFYNEVGDRIQATMDDYNLKKLPQLLEILGNYEKDSPQFEIYMSQINEDRVRQGKFIIEQMEQVSQRQNLVLQSLLSTKTTIIEQTGQITKSITDEYLKAQIGGLLPKNESIKQLSAGEIKQLTAGAEQ